MQSHADQFKDAGVGIAVITYDSPELQQAFVDEFSITYPLLSDVDATSIKALGLLNEEYSPGDAIYGIPHPGVLVIDSGQNRAAKVFLEGYDTRVEAAGVLEVALRALD